MDKFGAVCILKVGRVRGDKEMKPCTTRVVDAKLHFSTPWGS
jgi:hypothetical protein